MNMKSLFSNLPTILKLTYQDWQEDNASRLAAALAYYTIFSLAPLLVMVITITGLFLEANVAQTQILSQVRDLLGPDGADFVANLISNRGSPAEGIVALIIGIITLLLGALGVFNELHNSLNIIWNIRVVKVQGFFQSIKKLLIDRFLSFAMILAIGFLLLVSLVVTAILSAAQQTIGEAVPFSELLWQIVNLAISIGVITALFALMFKYLPDAEIAWHDAWIGAFFTSLLFSLGKAAIGIYLGNSAAASVFGAAGSLVLLLLWINYSAQILFFGAEFTQVYANQYGSKLVLSEVEVIAPERRESSGLQESSALRSQPSLPSSAARAISERERQIERQNYQTGRVLLAVILTSFLSGILTAILGFRKRL
jgi:membrane protein